MSNNEQFERDFDAFLSEEDSRIAALYRKLPRAEPDARLDATVLAMARRAATSTKRAHTPPRWLPALSAAAVVALAAGIAFRIGPTVWPQHNASSLQKSANENAVSAPTPALNAGQTREAEAFKDNAANKGLAAPPTTTSAAPVATPAAPPAGYVAPTKQEARVQSRKPQTAAQHVDNTPAAQAFPPQPVEQEKKAAELDGAAAANGVRRQAGGSLDEQPLDRKRDTKLKAPGEAPTAQMREEGYPATEPAPAAAPPARQPPEPLQPESATATGMRAAGAPAESMLAAPAAKAAPYRSKDPNARLYPEHWLANIRTMLHENRRDEALRSLAEFRKMYPDYHLPDDLRELE